MALPFPGEHGGLDGGPVELMVVAEEFGRRLVNLPYLASVVLGGHAVLFAGDARQMRADPARRRRRLPQGSRSPTRSARPASDLHDVATTASEVAGGFAITGRKDVVLYGREADRMVVAARTGGSRRDRNGISLFLVPGEAPGLTVEGHATHDGARAATVRFDDVRVGAGAMLGEPGAGLDTLERVVDHAIAFVCADALGGMRQVFETTLAYLKTRRQFDRPLGAFQALQHRMVDVWMDCELAHSSVLDATLSLGRETRARRLAASSAKVAVGEAARRVCEEGIQLHGAIGMTMDLATGHHLKRAIAMNASFGDPGHHLAGLRRAGARRGGKPR